MAPTRQRLLGIALETVVSRIGRNIPVDSANDASPAQAGTSPSDASEASDSIIYLGLGLGVGGAFLLGLTVLAIMILRKRAEHQRMIAAAEVQRMNQASGRQQAREVSRPDLLPGCNTLNPLQTRAGWGALSSNEAVNDPSEVPRSYRKKRSSFSLPSKLKKRGIPLKTFKRLTAILESPGSRETASPQVPKAETMPSAPGVDTNTNAQARKKVFNMQSLDEDDVFVCPGSPKPHVLPSFAIRSPGRYGAGIANGASRKGHRSQSLVAMPTITSEAPLEWSSRTWPASFHARSVSLGAPPSRPPLGPVPPLPIGTPLDDVENQDPARQGFCIRRMSSSSHESSRSSVLVATPILIVPEQNQTATSPSVEAVVAGDDTASLKIVPTKQWHQPVVNGPGRATNDAARAWDNRHTSVRANIARYSAGSLANRRMSCTYSESHLSIAHTDTADQISISRVSSSPSLHGGLGVRKVTTPKRLHRTSVSASGSPVERKKTNVLRDISGNSLGPSRQPSNATQDSNRSSNGNPFQWDPQPSARPSAMKGSPNARKGHRRQNCVRISTLVPQILGPPPSRSTSPSIMHGIEEESGESGDGDNVATQPETRFVTNQRLSRPPSSSSFAPNIRLKPLRASLTPSSPTLSTWTAYQEQGLPSQTSDSQISVSIGSRRSSRFSIPSFPSPVKATTSTTQLSRPIPEFYLSRPSTDTSEEGSSPFALRLSPDPEISSQLSKHNEYDPAWCMPRMSIPPTQIYDPASPNWPVTESERSSLSLPFATQAQASPGIDEVPSQVRKVSHGNLVPNILQVSPKAMPEGFQLFFDKKDSGAKPARACENLTSANASAIMARMPSRVDFPGAPTLSPPQQDAVYDQIAPLSKQRPISRNSRSSYLVPGRAAPLPPSSSKDSSMPSPLRICDKLSPTGPRNQPANSVLKNAMVLRRMNSEITVADRSSRRFVQLGREASPLLPWIGSPDLGTSCVGTNDLSGFDFATDDVTSGAEEYELGQDEFDGVDVEAKLDEALSGIAAATPSDCSSNVWEDGERFWSSPIPGTQIGVAKITPLAIEGTPERPKKAPDSPRSIQWTPKSLYDSDGFLKS